MIHQGRKPIAILLVFLLLCPIFPVSAQSHSYQTGTYSLSTGSYTSIEVESGANVTLNLSGTISKSGSGAVIVVHSGANLTINGGTITGGTGNVSSNTKEGGGIFVDSGTLTLNNVTITGNSANHGGGVYLKSGSTFTMNNSTVKNNTATNTGGGITSNVSTVNINNSTISGNSVSAATGGGLYMSGGTVTLSSTTVTNNSAQMYGGGAYVSNGTLNLSGTTSFSGNSTGTSGGAISNQREGTVNLSGSTNISSNTAKIGGGIHTSGSVTLKDSVVISSNTNSSGASQNLSILQNNTIPKVTGSLSSTAKIGIGVITNNGAFVDETLAYGSGYTLTDSDKSKFISDMPNRNCERDTAKNAIVLDSLPIYHDVTFKSNYPTNITEKTSTQTVQEGNTASSVSVNAPVGFSFNLWSEDPEGKKEWDFSTKIDESVTLYAQWVEDIVEEEEEIEEDQQNGENTYDSDQTVPTIPETEQSTGNNQNNSDNTPTEDENQGNSEENSESNSENSEDPSDSSQSPDNDSSNSDQENNSDETEPDQENDSETEDDPQENAQDNSQDESNTEDNFSQEESEDAEENPFQSEVFTDVLTTDWFHDAVYDVYENGLMSGTSATKFSPYVNTTRGMVATILYRLDGSPETSLRAIYPDVALSDYYAIPTVWAMDHDVFVGFSDGSFRPDAPITREDLALVLSQFALKKGVNMEINRQSLNHFYDKDQISAYAFDGLTWSVERGIMAGRTWDTLVPGAQATRSEMAMMLTNLVEFL